jgi:hypothetical protein
VGIFDVAVDVLEVNVEVGIFDVDVEVGIFDVDVEVSVFDVDVDVFDVEVDVVCVGDGVVVEVEVGEVVEVRVKVAKDERKYDRQSVDKKDKRGDVSWCMRPLREERTKTNQLRGETRRRDSEMG